MAQIVLYLLILAASIVGFGLLALSQKQHRATLIRAPGLFLRSANTQRVAATLLLGASLCLAIVRDGIGFGIVVWCLSITVSALCVVAALAWAKHERVRCDLPGADADDS